MLRNADFVIDNTKIAPAIAKTAELGSLDEATDKLFRKISSNAEENGKLTFPEPCLYNGYGDYYQVNYTSADNSLSIDRNATSYTLNGQKQEIPKLGNQQPKAIFVIIERYTQNEGAMYVPESVYTLINGK